jgi:hypothetical protein
MAIAFGIRAWCLPALVFAGLAATIFGVRPSSADEGGASFWSPGTFANLAAIPGLPGWTFSATYFHTSVSGGSNVATADTLPLFPRATVSLRRETMAKPERMAMNAEKVINLKTLHALGLFRRGDR